jgi:hypothetical protein
MSGKLPAYNTGKALNPKITIIQNMKKHLEAKAPYLLEAKAAGEHEAAEVAMTSEAAEAVEEVNPMEQSLIYDIVTTEVIGIAPTAVPVWNIVRCLSSTFPRSLKCAATWLCGRETCPVKHKWPLPIWREIIIHGELALRTGQIG